MWTGVLSRSQLSPSSVLLVSVVGAARVGADIYSVECDCGSLFGIEVNDLRVLAKMYGQIKNLRNSCASLGLDVRSGTLVDGI